MQMDIPKGPTAQGRPVLEQRRGVNKKEQQEETLTISSNPNIAWVSRELWGEGVKLRTQKRRQEKSVVLMFVFLFLTTQF